MNDDEVKQNRLQNAVAARNKYHSGEKISDFEIRDGISVIKDLIVSLSEFGEVYSLITSDLKRCLSWLMTVRDCRKGN